MSMDIDAVLGRVPKGQFIGGRFVETGATGYRIRIRLA